MSNRIWNASLLLLAVAFLVLLAGFASSVLRTRELAGRLEAPKTAGPSPLRVALISQELDNPFWRSVEEGARASAARYGMEIEYSGPLRIDASEQARLLDKSIAEGFDALLVQGADDPAYAALIDRAADEGIPVVTIDADEPDSRRIAYVGTDNKRAGEEMGRLVVRTVGESGGIGVLLGSEAVNQRLRLEGFRGVLARYPKLTVADVRISNISRLQAAQQAEAMLRENPGLRAIVGFSSLDGLGIAEAVQREQASSTVSVFAFDDLENTRQAIRQSRIEATIVQKPYSMGWEAVEVVRSYLGGLKPPALRLTGTAVLDKAALEAGNAGDGVSADVSGNSDAGGDSEVGGNSDVTGNSDAGGNSDAEAGGNGR